jgi:hypothetical protein
MNPGEAHARKPDARRKPAIAGVPAPAGDVPAPPVGDFPEFVACWNDLQKLETPEIHVRIARWLSERWAGGERNLLLLAFRGSGKSTLVGLFAAWLLARDPNLRILILSADHKLARKMARNVRRLVERHPLAEFLVPRKREEWASDCFTVARTAQWRDPSVLAHGLGANITGSRADVAICDDVEVPKTCDTAGKRADLRERLKEIEYVLNPGGLKLYVGTPHTYYSIYADAARPEADEERPHLDGFARLEIPLLDGEGRSAWPERFPPERIAANRKSTGPIKFARQMLLRFVSAAEARLDPAKMGCYEGELVYTEGNGEATLTLEGHRLASASCWWDPAYGARERGDSSAVAAVFVDEDGHHWLHRIAHFAHGGGPDPDGTSEAVQLCRQVATFARDLHIPTVRVEDNGLGQHLPGLLRQEIRTLGFRVTVVAATSVRTKDSRILGAFDALLAAGQLSAHRSVWRSPFIAEMREWRPRGKTRDDALDAVAGCLLAEPVRLPRRAPAFVADPTPKPDWRPGAGQYMAKTEFDV